MLVFLVLTAIRITVSAQSVEPCSPLCECDVWLKLQRTSCTGRHLYSVDIGSVNNVQALDLSDNVVSSLNAFELVQAGLQTLKYLNLSRNAVSEIDMHAFYGLDNLTVLDLSNNYLRSIPNDVFAENKYLQIVHLSRNNFRSHVPKLQSLSITELNLDFCQISHLPSDTFNGLPRLRRLSLGKNMMIQMNRSVVQKLTSLRAISLEGNPWSCNKEISDLNTHLVQRGVTFQEICGKKQPRKFEKMVVAPVKQEKNYHRSATTVVIGTATNEHNLTRVSNNKTQPIAKTLERMMPVFDSIWLLVLGFICGVACALIISYVWLSGICPRSQYLEEEDFMTGPRVQLIVNSLLNDSIDSLNESRFGTPPPSYREVMLQPNRYLSRTLNPNHF